MLGIAAWLPLGMAAFHIRVADSCPSSSVPSASFLLSCALMLATSGMATSQIMAPALGSLLSYIEFGLQDLVCPSLGYCGYLGSEPIDKESVVCLLFCFSFCLPDKK